MATIPAKISQLQDVIQEKLTAAKVAENVQDKIGNFVLHIINDNIILAKTVSYFLFAPLPFDCYPFTLSQCVRFF
jgi:hypothetical protein